MLKLMGLVNLILVAAAAVLVVRLLRERGLRKRRTFTGNWPVQPVLPEHIDPLFHYANTDYSLSSVR